jgi:hypothetical protein
MIEAKKFLFLNKIQRWGISLGLFLALSGAIFLIVFSKIIEPDNDLKILGIDLVKMCLTAIAAWIVVLLYVKTNSFERIVKEKISFLTIDIPKAFRTATEAQKSLPLDPVNESLSIEIILQTASTAIYKFSNLMVDKPLFFYCKISLHNLQLLFFLPPEHGENYLTIYRSAISFWTKSDVGCEVNGIVAARWLGSTDKRFFELLALRKLPEDFLFDEGLRTHYSEIVFGDARAILLRMQAAIT